VGIFEIVAVPAILTVAARALFIVVILRVPPASTVIAEVAFGLKVVILSTPPDLTLIIAAAAGVKVVTVIFPKTLVVEVPVGE